MGRGVFYFASSACVYVATLVPLLWLSSPWLRFPLALVNGLSIAMLFIVGHDACHGSLTPSARWNYALGQLSFLPALHPFTSWNLSHNTLHHAWTNLRGHDPGYPPRSPEEFARLGSWRQAEARFHRTVPGLPFLYLRAVWWPYIIAPARDTRVVLERIGRFERERIGVLAYGAALTTVAVAAGVMKGDALWRAAIVDTLWVVVVPFWIWNWLIAWATFMHHTHPDVRWFEDQHAWHDAQAQLISTVHVVFPRWFERLLHDIMQHTAHHVDPNVPLYHLADAQASLEHARPHHVIVVPFTVRHLRRSLRTCRLYDYRTHTWHDWDGTPLYIIGTGSSAVAVTGAPS